MASNEEEAFYAGLGKRLAEERRKKKITQAALAGVVGLSRTSITNIEKGRQFVQVYTLVRLAQALGRSVLDLLPLEEAPGQQYRKSLLGLSEEKKAWVERVLTTPPAQEGRKP